MRDKEFARIGARLFKEGLIGGNFGNISVRAEDGFYITRTGSYLDDPGIPVFVPLDDPAPSEASSEYRVHREVYKNTRHQAIVHAHPPYVVGASLVYDEIVPVDNEGEIFCPIIPVVGGKPGSDAIARNVADANALGAIVLALLISDIIGVIVSLIGTVTGVMNAFGWSAVIIYLFLAIGFTYFRFKKPTPA